MAITYKQVNVLQEFGVSDMDICIKVWEQLVGKDEHILVSYQTNMDDPRDVTFVVGATDNNHLHEFILKHAGAWPQHPLLAKRTRQCHECVS